MNPHESKDSRRDAINSRWVIKPLTFDPSRKTNGNNSINTWMEESVLTPNCRRTESKTMLEKGVFTFQSPRLIEFQLTYHQVWNDHSHFAHCIASFGQSWMRWNENENDANAFHLARENRSKSIKFIKSKIISGKKEKSLIRKARVITIKCSTNGASSKARVSGKMFF